LQHAESKTITLPEPTNFTPELTKYALFLLRKIFRKEYRYIKAGVMLGNIVPETPIQLNAFIENRDHSKRINLMKTMDKVNRVWGRDMLKLASSGIKQDWAMKRQFISQRYTTNWNELLTINVN
jgi:DNA polymerase V